MKRIVLVLLIVVAMSGSAFGATLNLRATWTANTESDMKEYKLYRTDGTRTLIGTIAHPTATYNFSVTVPDGSSGTLRFVLTAVDNNNNTSADSTAATYNYNLDSVPPAVPKNLSIALQ
jgi:fibronectin type 3 domain-containing protein